MFHDVSHPMGLSVKYPTCHRSILTLGSEEKQVEQVECGGKQEHTERKKENEVHIGFRDRASLRSLLSLCLLACFLSPSLWHPVCWLKCVCLSVCVRLCLCFSQWCLLLRLNLPLEVFHFNHGGCYCSEYRGIPQSEPEHAHTLTHTEGGLYEKSCS